MSQAINLSLQIGFLRADLRFLQYDLRAPSLIHQPEVPQPGKKWGDREEHGAALWGLE